MPGYKKSKVPAWKRKAGARKGKRRAGYKTVSLVGKSLNPIPQRMIAKHKYAASVSLPTGGNSWGLHQFNLNSTYDPDRTGIGRQPYGRDTYATLYNKYRVIACTWRVAAIPVNAARVIQMAVVPTNSTPTGSATMAEFRELPRCKYIIQQPTAPQQFCSGKSYIPSLMGRTKAQYMADDTYAANIGTSPSELALLNVFVGTFDDSVATESFLINVEMEYTVEWFDPQPLPSS